MSQKSKQISKKILVLGLDNSGKTSLALNFIGSSNLSKLATLERTNEPKVINFEKNDYIFNIWDFGGREENRTEFLKNFQKFIKNTEEIFYVIDIQDIERYDLALNFLNEIIKRTKALKIKMEVTIFLHKYDHDLFEMNVAITESIINNLIVKIKEIIPLEYFHEIYKSTIYTVLDKIHVY